MSCNVPGRSITSVAVSSGEDHAAVLCSSNEILTLSMEALNDYEEKQMQQLVGNLGEQASVVGRVRAWAWRGKQAAQPAAWPAVSAHQPPALSEQTAVVAPPALLQDHDPFHLVGGGVGSPGIVGMDAIVYQPLLAIATLDKQVRIVNYKSRWGSVTGGCRRCRQSGGRAVGAPAQLLLGSPLHPASPFLSARVPAGSVLWPVR